MIWESHPWKVDLYKRAQWLKAKKNQRRWPDSARVRVEQCVMLGCYCVRKLIEAGKLTESVAQLKVPVFIYKPRGKPVDSMNWHRLDELYNLETGAEGAKPLMFVCNQLIHSFVYINGFADGGGFEFVMFCSDFERNTSLFQVSVDDLVEAFLQVADDDVVEGHYIWNKKQNDYDRIQR